MIALTLAEIATAVAGKLELQDTTATPATVISGNGQTDSREIQPGQIFFARRGEETDGHLYAAAAAERGAALIIAERHTGAAAPHIIVADTTAALAALAAYVIATVKARGKLRIVGVTGSNGKTSTKNLLAAMLQRLGSTVANEKSFNNEVGGPLTMLRVTADTEYLVAEMGASGPGEIAQLTRLAPPDYGVVLMVGMAHAGGFGSLEVTAKTKAEMVTGLPATATAVLNAADPRVAAMAEQTAARVRFFNGPQVRAENVVTDATGSSFDVVIDEQKIAVRFNVLGEHHINNALAAAAVASDLGLSLESIKEVLEQVTRPAKWRMEVHHLRDGITLINDAYNANPDSMDAALKTLAQVADPRGRSIAVLGEMSELGEHAGPAHDRVGLQAVRLRLGKLVVVGENVRRMYITAVNEGAWDDSEAHYCETAEQALEYLTAELQPHDTVLVKSSNAAGLRFLGDKLAEALA